jgi:hypothetical protein
MEILIPISFFAMIAALFIVPRYFKSKEREALQATIRAAIERGQSLSPDTVDAITTDLHLAKPVPSAVRDLRAAVIWLAVAVGIALCGYTFAWHEGEDFYPALGIAAIPGLVGLAYLAMAAINASMEKKHKVDA